MYYGEKVVLDAYKRDYLETALSYVNDYDVVMYLTPKIPFPLRKEDEDKFYDRIDAFSDGKYNFAILLKDTKEYIGGCGINKVDWKNSFCEVGIFLGKPFLNKGYGTDAMKTLTSFIFKEMSLNKIKLSVFSFNKRAIKSYEKCGFSVEGNLREEVFRNGRFNDVVVMGLLRREWEKTT